MTIVSLDHLIGMVRDVRIDIFDLYKARPAPDPLILENNEYVTDHVRPLMSYSPDGPTLKEPCGAFRYRLHRGKGAWEEGTGGALFELLPRMPKDPDELRLCGDIKPLASISAGKYNQGDVGHFDRYAYANMAMSERTRWIHHLPLLPVMMGILNRFAMQMESLPKDIEWREDLSHLIRAA